MRALILVLLLACGSKEDTYKPTALQFAKLLVARDFVAAHGMLAPPAPSQAELQQRFDEMVEPIGALGDVEVMETMDDWPDKQPGDIGWVYVSIAGEDGGEAVTVAVTRDRRIRILSWGRP